MAVRLVESDSWLDRVGGSFARELLREELAPKTVRTYGNGVKNFFSFLRDQGVDDFHYITRDHIERWQDSMRESPLKAGSRSLYSTAVRRLLTFAADHDIVEFKLVRSIKGVRTRRKESDVERQPIPEEDLEVLMAYLGPLRARMTVIDYRDRALFYFLLETGMRVNEALQVMRDHYLMGRVRQKGGTYVDFEITETVDGMVKDYLHARRDDHPELWIKHGNNISVQGVLQDSGVREIWTRLCQRLGIPRFTTHQLRHTSGTVLIEHDVDSLAVAKHLNHADLRTVHKYAKIRRRQQQKTLAVMEEFIRVGSRPRLLPKVGRRGYGR